LKRPGLFGLVATLLDDLHHSQFLNGAFQQGLAHWNSSGSRPRCRATTGSSFWTATPSCRGSKARSSRSCARPVSSAKIDETSAEFDSFFRDENSKRGDDMGRYHLYFLRDSQVIGSDSIDAQDDDEAIRLARDHGEGNAVEVWNAHSRIRVLAPGQPAAPS
jgi:hypothetical protein